MLEVFNKQSYSSIFSCQWLSLYLHATSPDRRLSNWLLLGPPYYSRMDNQGATVGIRFLYGAAVTFASPEKPLPIFLDICLHGYPRKKKKFAPHTRWSYSCQGIIFLSGVGLRVPVTIQSELLWAISVGSSHPY